MLHSLHIENIAVIRDAEVEFAPGFTVMTGETGAGKSMIIDGINLLLGNRASKEIIRTGAQRAAVSAMFCDLDAKTAAVLAALDVTPDDEGVLFLSRTISVDSGDGTKSQTKINGHNIPATLGREVGRLLVGIHGQNDNQTLLDRATHINFLDEYADIYSSLAQYYRYYEKMMATAAEIKALKQDESVRSEKISLLKAQLAEIDEAKLREDEDITLTQRREKLANMEKIQKQVNLVHRALAQNEKGVTAAYLIERAAAALTSLEGIMPDAAALAASLSDYKFEIEDIAERTYAFIADYDDDPTAELNRIEERLDLITKFKRKYGENISDIIAFRSKIAQMLEGLENSDNTLAELAARYNDERQLACECAERISAARMAAGEKIEREILDTLIYLDMPNVRFWAGVTRRTHEDGRLHLSRAGCDDVEFMISTNPGEPLAPLAKIASGGELARIMLALKSVLSDKAGTGTVIFDEIDSGISGKTSQKIGIKLKQLAAVAQIICVTHSAQIASVADRHCLIEKFERDGRAETDVRVLDDEGRAGELARIIGGIAVTEKTLDAARELLLAGKNLQTIKQEIE